MRRRLRRPVDAQERRLYRLLIVAAVAGRVPTSAMALIPTLLVQSAGGSLQTAGIATAAFLMVSGLSAPLRGRRVDRAGYGGGLVVPAVASCVIAVVVAALVGETVLAGPLGIGLLAAIGIAWPPIGIAVQKGWRTLRPSPADQEAVFALDVALQRISLVLGPLLAGALTAVASPRAALAAVAVLNAAAVGLIGALPLGRAAAAPRMRTRRRRLPQGPPRSLRTLLPTVLLTDAAIGFVQVGVPGFMASHGSAALAGPIVAVFLLASASGALLLSRLSFARPIDARYQLVVRASVLGLAPLSLVDTRAGLAAAAVFAGLAVAAKVPTAVALAARLTPADHHAETMGWLISASWVGVAIGAAVAGVVGDAFGPRAALTGVPVSAAIAAGFLYLRRHRLRADVEAADAAAASCPYSRCSSPTTGDSVKPPTLRTASSTPGMKETRSIVS